MVIITLHMPSEISIPDYIPDTLREKYVEMEKERLKDAEVFEAWWKQLDEKRQEKYQKLDLFASDSGDTRKEKAHPYHLRRCKLLLEIVDRAVTPDGKKIYPVAMAIHGDSPVVFYDLEEANEATWKKNRDEISYTEQKDDRNIWSDVDTTDYGFPAERSGAMGFKLKAEEWKKVDEWMKGLVE